MLQDRPPAVKSLAPGRIVAAIVGRSGSGRSSRRSEDQAVVAGPLDPIAVRRSQVARPESDVGRGVRDVERGHGVVVPSLVLNIAHEPGCVEHAGCRSCCPHSRSRCAGWLAAAKVATNSSTRPALKPVVLVGVRRPPSTLTSRPRTSSLRAAVAPQDARPAVGRRLPENSFPSVGARITSPSPVVTDT